MRKTPRGSSGRPRVQSNREPVQSAAAAAPAGRTPGRPALTTALAVALAVAAFLASHWVDTRWAQQEDAYITYQYAHRLASGQGFTFSPAAAPSYGTTTPLWTLLLAAVDLAHVRPHLVAPWLTSLCHGLTAGLLVLLGTALGGVGVGLTAGAIWAVSLAVFFRVGGMETALVMCLSAALALLLLSPVRRRWGIGVVCGLLLLTRPDTVLLVGLVFIALAVDRETRTRVLLPALIATVLVCLPWAVYAQLTFGDIVPNSLRAKLAVPNQSGRMCVASFLAEFLPGASGGIALIVLAAIGAGGAAVLWVRAPSQRAFIVWAPYYYAVFARGGAPDFAWYYVPPLWFCAILLATCLHAIVGCIPAVRWRPLFMTIAAAALVAVLGWYNWVALGFMRYTRWPKRVQHALAEQVRDMSRTTDLVAAMEVGNLAYWSDRPVLDLLGLTSPPVIPWVRHRDFAGIIAHWRPRFVVVTGMDEILAGTYEKKVSLPFRNNTQYVIWERKSATASR